VALGGLCLLLGLNWLRPEASVAPPALGLRSGLAPDAPPWRAPGQTLEAWPGLLPSDFPEPAAPRRTANPKRKAAPAERTAEAKARPKQPPARVASARPDEPAQPDPPRGTSAPDAAGESGWVIRRR
jgi:hypothetical protein